MTLNMEQASDAAVCLPFNLSPIKSLGSGGMADIYLYRSSDGKVFAGKHQPVSHYSRMEVEALKKIKSIRIVEYFGEFFARHNNRERHIIFMEMAGVNLITYQSLIGLITRAFIIRAIAAQLIEGLIAIHKAGFIHCDLSLYNILVKGNQFKICDFGLVSPIDSKPHIPKGTHQSKAPEVLLFMEYDSKIDVWGLGCILIWLIIGAMPFGNSCDRDVTKLLNDIGYKIGFPERYQKHLSRSVSYSAYRRCPFRKLRNIIGYDNWHMICCCLRTDPKERWSSVELSQHFNFNKAFYDSCIPIAKPRPKWGSVDEEEIRMKLERRYQENTL